MTQKMASRDSINNSTDVVESVADKSQTAADSNAQGIFAERFHLFTDAFGKLCNDENIKTSIAIVVDQKLPESQPIVFMRGSEYDAAIILAKVLRQLQEKIYRNIATQI